MNSIADFRQSFDRGVHHEHGRREREKLPLRHGSADHTINSIPENSTDPERCQNFDHRRRGGIVFENFSHEAIEFQILSFKALALALFTAKSLDHFDTGKRFLQNAGQPSHCMLPLTGIFLNFAANIRSR